jgi:ribonuclease-3
MGERTRQLERLQGLLGVRFHNVAMLDEALTHSSFGNENPESGLPDNQRLEFLGDAILGFVVGQWLFDRYRDANEGELTSLRADIVRTEALSEVAQGLDLGNHLRLGRGEAGGGGALRPANLCAAFEALVGAIYFDQGLDSVVAWVHDLLEARQAQIEALRQVKDAKSRLQECVQAALRVTPAYRIVHEQGPDHAKMFTAQVLVGDDVWGEGTGANKQAAQQAAAADALARPATAAPNDA